MEKGLFTRKYQLDQRLHNRSIIFQLVPALQACQTHQQHPGVLEDPGIQGLQQVPALLSHQKVPKKED